MIKWETEQSEKKESKIIVVRNIKEASLRYSGNKRFHTLRFENTIQLKQLQGFCRILSASTDFFVPFKTQGVLLSLTHFAFLFLYWIFPATLLTQPHLLLLSGWIMQSMASDLNSHTSREQLLVSSPDNSKTSASSYLSYPPVKCNSTENRVKEKVTSSVKTSLIG